MTLKSHIAIFLLLATGVPGAADAAESYDNCTGFITALPATVDTQGTWCLRENLSTAIASGSAITIATNNATIDCNDFKIGGLAAGDGTNAHGIGANSRNNIVIRNCNIRGFRYGIDLDGTAGGGHLVESNRLDNNTFLGIAVDGDGSLVRNNAVNDTGGTTLTFDTRAYGIYVIGAVDVIDNSVSNVVAYQVSGGASAEGIVAFNNRGGSIQRNRVRGLVPGPDPGADELGIVNGNALSYGEISDNVVIGNNVDDSGDTAIYCSFNAPALASNNRILRFGDGTQISTSCIDGGNLSDSPM